MLSILSIHRFPIHRSVHLHIDIQSSICVIVENTTPVYPDLSVISLPAILRASTLLSIIQLTCQVLRPPRSL